MKVHKNIHNHLELIKEKRDHIEMTIKTRVWDRDKTILRTRGQLHYII